MEYKYFEVPTQIKFTYEDEICYGIGFHEYVICACCGGVFSVNEITIVTALNWVDFKEAIAE